MANILIVDDESAIRQMVGFTVTGDGYTIEEAGDADEATAMIQESTPDLILLDWMLPGVSGVDFAKRLKRDPATRDIPIIMLTAKVEDDDKVTGLDSGCDDYVTKPFSTKELLARIRAVMRRRQENTGMEVIDVQGLQIEIDTHRVSIHGQPIELSPTEFRLLHFFVTHPERVYNRSQLLDSVWGNNAYIEERTVDVHIRRLRKILNPYQFDQYIQTVRSVGYRFSTQVAVPAEA